MKSPFADFLQNVTPPGALKQGYTVYNVTSLWSELKTESQMTNKIHDKYLLVIHLSIISGHK